MGCVHSYPSPLIGITTEQQHKKSDNFQSKYSFYGHLGTGSFSKVIRARDRKTNKSVAVKVVSKIELGPSDRVSLRQEIDILRELDHINIIKLEDVVYEGNKHWYIITELVKGGDLFDRLRMKGRYNEDEARGIFTGILKAITYCHSKKIAHRDLKPENILLVSKSNDMEIKIADFGFAKKVTSDHCLRTRCGTPAYIAPEILQDLYYGMKADMWSLGVILYYLVAGYLPFNSGTQSRTLSKIQKGSFEFHPWSWEERSVEVKNMISGLLTVDPGKRMSAKGAMYSSWMLRTD